MTSTICYNFKVISYKSDPEHVSTRTQVCIIASDQLKSSDMQRDMIVLYFDIFISNQFFRLSPVRGRFFRLNSQIFQVLDSLAMVIDKSIDLIYYQLVIMIIYSKLWI